MKLILTFVLSFVFLSATESINNSEITIALATDTNASNELVVVEDTSGMTNDEVREEAKKNDANVKKKEELNTAIDSMLSGISNTKIDKEKTWRELSPAVKNYDWIQTKSGEWFKGYIKAMFNRKLEFDSDEIGTYSFKFKDITQIKSYQIIGVNIEDVAIFEGVIRLKNNNITIVQGNNKFEFPKSEVVSFAHAGSSEKDKWYAKVTISMDWRNGNTNQLDYSAQGIFKRRSAKSRLVLDYLGRYSAISEIETVNDHRLNEKFDIYFTKNFYWTPLFSEYYKDKFKNIDAQLTAGAGVGYMLINTDETEWDITSGPAMLFTNYISVGQDEEEKVASYSAEFDTKYETEVTNNIDFIYTYKFSLTDKASGRYKHHMMAKLENELNKWLDLDFTYIWDYIDEPTKNSNGNIPKKDDYQFLIGLGVEY